MSDIRKGDTVRWRRDEFPAADRTPMVVYERHGAAVRVDGPAGSLVAIGLLELMEAHPEGPPSAPVQAVEDDGLMAVIEVQMAALDDAVLDAQTARDDVEALKRELEDARKEIEDLDAYNAGSDEGFREEVERMLGNVCIALGFPREPLQKTGLPELDALVRYVATA